MRVSAIVARSMPSIEEHRVSDQLTTKNLHAATRERPTRDCRFPSSQWTDERRAKRLRDSVGR